MVLTNVPGPRQQLYFAGAPLKSIMFWVPQAGEVGLGISIISYNSMVMVGLMVDEQLVADPAALIRGFEREVDNLEQRYLATQTPSVNGAGPHPQLAQQDQPAATQ
jgi:hypothetical protein